jgi:leucyl aminopeptidase
MKFYTTTKDITSLSADAVVVFAREGDKEPEFVKQFHVKEDGFQGKLGEVFVIQTQGQLPYKKVFVTGLGKEKQLSAYDWHYVYACIARCAKARKVARLVIPTTDVYNAVVGLCLGAYSFLVHKNKKTQKEEQRIEKITFVGKGIDQKDITDGVITAEAVCFARDLVNEPPSVTTPSFLAHHAEKFGAEVFGKKEMKKLGMNALLAVSQGSHEEPKFIKLEYRGGGTKTITLVGKGITYDSGGLSLKPQSGLETMKCDMAGAATILGVFEALHKGKPKVHVIGLIAACENMPGGGAVKPGDVVTAMNGKTIEIVNTDAEGRIILADSLSYAGKFIPSNVIIDVATLTGACVVALGEDIAGLFTDNEKLAKQVLDNATRVGEKLWRMPIACEYEEHLKSEIADIRNVSKTKYGGAINGALFLKKFAPKGTPWAHLDIAGPAFAEKDMTISPYGGTGFGVQTLLSFIEGEEGKR